MVILAAALIWLFAGIALFWWLAPRATSFTSTAPARIATALVAGAILGPGIVVLQEGGAVVPTGFAIGYWILHLPQGMNILALCIATWALTAAILYLVLTMRAGAVTATTVRE